MKFEDGAKVLSLESTFYSSALSVP